MSRRPVHHADPCGADRLLPMEALQVNPEFQLRFAQTPSLDDVRDAMTSRRHSFAYHRLLQTDAHDLYSAEFILQAKRIPSSVKVTALLCAFDRHDRSLIKLLLSPICHYSIVDVLRVCETLDLARRTRLLRRMLIRLRTPERPPPVIHGKRSDAQPPQRRRQETVLRRGISGRPRRRFHHAPPKSNLLAQRRSFKFKIKCFREMNAGERAQMRRNRKYGKYVAELNRLQRMAIPRLTATLSGQAAAYFRGWAATVGASQITHDATCFRQNLWRRFADRVHLNPTKTNCPTVVFQSPRNLRKRKRQDDLDAKKKGVDSKQLPSVGGGKLCDDPRLSEHPNCEDANTSFCLSIGQFLHHNREKSCQKMLVLQHLRAARRALQNYALPLPTPIHILGECGVGADKCIEIASILALLLGRLAETKLHFFNERCREPPFIPRTIEDVSELSDIVRSAGGACPGAALEDLYLKGERIEALVLVSCGKEEREAPTTGLGFHQILQSYIAEVNPMLRVVLISLLESMSEPSVTGFILESTHIPFEEIKLNIASPDFQRMEDRLLWRLSCRSPFRAMMVKTLAFTCQHRESLVFEQSTYDEDTITFDSTFADLHDQYQREGVAAVVSVLRQAINVAPPTTFPQLQELVVEFLQLFRDTDAIACALSMALGGVESMDGLKEYVSSWDIGFLDDLDEALNKNWSERTYANCGTLGQLPHELLVAVCEYLPMRDLRCAETICGKLRIACHEAKYIVKFIDPEAEYIIQLATLREMGILHTVDEEVAIDVLKATKGDLAHCIALLMGEAKPR